MEPVRTGTEVERTLLNKIPKFDVRVRRIDVPERELRETFQEGVEKEEEEPKLNILLPELSYKFPSFSIQSAS